MVFGVVSFWEGKSRPKEERLPGLEQRLEEVLQKRKENEEKQKELVRKKALYYQEWKEGKIDREEYLYRKACCEQEISRREKEKKSEEIVRGKTAGGKMGEDEDLPEAWMNTFIERIEVFEKNRIKVYFSFAAMGEWG